MLLGICKISAFKEALIFQKKRRVFFTFRTSISRKIQVYEKNGYQSQFTTNGRSEQTFTDLQETRWLGCGSLQLKYNI